MYEYITETTNRKETKQNFYKMGMAWHAPVLGLVPASPGPVLASHRLKQWHQPERPVGRKRKDKKNMVGLALFHWLENAIKREEREAILGLAWKKNREKEREGAILACCIIEIFFLRKREIVSRK